MAAAFYRLYPKKFLQVLVSCCFFSLSFVLFRERCRCFALIWFFFSLRFVNAMAWCASFHDSHLVCACTMECTHRKRRIWCASVAAQWVRIWCLTLALFLFECVYIVSMNPWMHVERREGSSLWRYSVHQNRSKRCTIARNMRNVNIDWKHKQNINEKQRQQCNNAKWTFIDSSERLFVENVRFDIPFINEIAVLFVMFFLNFVLNFCISLIYSHKLDFIDVPYMVWHNLERAACFFNLIFLIWIIIFHSILRLIIITIYILEIFTIETPSNVLYLCDELSLDLAWFSIILK